MDVKSIIEGQAAPTYEPHATTDLQPTSHHAVGKQSDTAQDEQPTEDELLERLVYYLFSHSIFRPARKPLILYLRDQIAIKPIRPSPSLEIVTDLPSMFIGSLPLLISIWFLTNYCWIPLCGLMVWERMGSDVMYEVLSWTWKGVGSTMNVSKSLYENVTVMTSSAAMSKGARRALPWVDGQMDDNGALGSLLYPHCGSS